MRKINYLLSLLAIVVVVTSCEKKSDDDGKTSNVTVTANRDYDDNTKLVIGEIPRLVFAWETDDKLGVYVKDMWTGSPSLFSLTKGEGENYGSFTGELNVNGPEHVYAVYPYDEVKKFTKESGVEYTFTLPTVQEQKYDTNNVLTIESIADYAFMAGQTVNPVVEGDDIDIRMENLMTVIDFNLSDIPPDTKIHSLTLRATEAMFVNYATVNFSTGTPIIKLGPITGKNLTVNVNGDGASGVETTSGALTIRLAVFPQTFAKGKEWIIELATSKGKGTFATEISNFVKTFGASGTTYKAGKRYDAGLKWGDFNELKIPPVTSNCFIVAPSGSVEVPINNVNVFWNKGGDGAIATYMGEVWSKPNLAASAVDENLIADDTYVAEVVWTDIPEGVNVTFSKKDTHFTVSNMPSTPGNIVVGVKKAGANSDDPYLWSWHLWVTDYDPNDDANNTIMPSGKVAMDRDLGATNATIADVGALGLYYQWGRKDPFPASSTIDTDIVRTTYPAALPDAVIEGYGTLLKIVENPAVFYGSSSDVISSGHLYKEKGNNRWKVASSHTVETPTKGIKSIYDPCPDGWRLPWARDWSGFHRNNLLMYLDDFATYPGRIYTDAKGKIVWFSASGFCDDSDGSLASVGKHGFAWSGTPDVTNSPSSRYSCYYLSFNDEYVLSRSNDNRSYGHPVRAVRE